MNYDSIVSIDIWSSKIKTIIWNVIKKENSQDELVILWNWVSDSNAIRKWNILDLEEFKDNLDKSLALAEKMAAEEIHTATISFNSSSFEIITSKWVIAISWEEITQNDVDRVLDAAKSWVNMPNKEIIKVIPKYFIVDLEEWVKNPVWMFARKLEVVALVFMVNSNILNNIKKAVLDVWVEILDVYPNLINSWEWVLTKRQKELWVVCIDIWAATTWVSVYEEWSLIHSAIIPIGWDNVTNDIALWARVSIEIAEKLKLEYSSIELQENKKWLDSEIPFKKLWLNEEWWISKEYLNQIVTARYEEILEYVKKELKLIWKDWMLPEWAVFVWGAAKQKWLIELSKEILRLPSFIWIPSINDELIDNNLWDPIFAAVIWNLILTKKYLWEYSSFSLNFKWFLESIIKLYKKIIP